MEQITRDGDIITIKSEVTKVIDLSELRAELAELEAIEEPSDEDLLAHAKQGLLHPYYEPDREYRISELRREVEKWLSQ